MKVGKRYQHIKMLDAVMDVIKIEILSNGIRVKAAWILPRDTGDMLLAYDDFVIEDVKLAN